VCGLPRPLAAADVERRAAARRHSGEHERVVVNVVVPAGVGIGHDGTLPRLAAFADTANRQSVHDLAGAYRRFSKNALQRKDSRW
jgi:hypothetical protein